MSDKKKRHNANPAAICRRTLHILNSWPLRQHKKVWFFKDDGLMNNRYWF